MVGGGAKALLSPAKGTAGSLRQNSGQKVWSVTGGKARQPSQALHYPRVCAESRRCLAFLTNDTKKYLVTCEHHIKFQFRVVFISWGCCKKVLQTGGLRTVICWPRVLEAWKSQAKSLAAPCSL